MLCRTSSVSNDQNGPSIGEMRAMLENQHKQDFYPAHKEEAPYCEICQVTESDFWTWFNGKRICRACLALKEDRLLIAG